MWLTPCQLDKYILKMVYIHHKSSVINILSCPKTLNNVNGALFWLLKAKLIVMGCNCFSKQNISM